VKRILHWFRRDLRVSDNTALYAACEDADELIPVYTLSSWDRNHPWTGPNRQEFLCSCLASLGKNLEAIGGRLILRSGSPVKELIRLAEETQAEAIYFNENYAPYDRDIEEQMQKAARANGIRVQRFKDTVILAPTEVVSQSGQPFRVFTA
jgi:deoxyribodipyrimidine photo-lyase